MPAPQYDISRTGDVLDAQLETQKLAQQLGPIASGKLLTVTVNATETVITHGLGNVPTGWVLVSPKASATLYETSSPTATTLYLIASSAVTCKIWVF
jgi:hypothetical protein